MAKYNADHQRTYRERKKGAWLKLQSRVDSLNEANKELRQRLEELKPERTDLVSGKFPLGVQSSRLYRQIFNLWSLLSLDQKMQYLAAMRLQDLTGAK